MKIYNYYGLVQLFAWALERYNYTMCLIFWMKNKNNDGIMNVNDYKYLN
jgi:hypothetical protein